MDVVYPDLSWFEPDGFNLFEKEAICWSEQLRFSSWNLNWRSNKLKCLNLSWQAQRFWHWTILQISVKNYWENQWEKNQPISSDLQFSFRRRQCQPTPVLLPGKIPWMEEPGGLQSTGSLGVGHDWATSLSLFTFMHWRWKWQPTPVFLPGESQGWWSQVGCRLWGCRVGHDWSDLAAAAAKGLEQNL